ncbi:hypothetical protein D7V90_10180 [bacterium 1xD42-87]|nr:hypothetical protein D7V90_10180 [bacterium 1xD42-87]
MKVVPRNYALCQETGRGRSFARISRVRKRQRQDACPHARLSMAIYEEQREREMRSISSLLMRRVRCQHVRVQ